MGEVHGSAARLYANGLDLSTLFREADSGSEHRVNDSTTFGATADSHVVDPSSVASMTAAGLLDVATADGAHPAFELLQDAHESLAADSVIVHMIRDTTLGDPGFALVGSLPKLGLKQPHRELVETMLEAAADGVYGWGKSLHPKGAETAAASGVGIDHGAATASGCISVLQVFALTGTDPVIRIKAQDSADSTDGEDGTWADLATHTDIDAAGVTAGYADVQQTTGAVDDWTRFDLSVVSGSLTSITFAHLLIRIPD